MSRRASMRPELIRVGRTELRNRQRRLLRGVKGRTVLVVQGSGGGGDRKYILDEEYFQKLLQSFESMAETLEIMADRRLFEQILAAGETLEADLKGGKLHRFEEAFPGE